MKRRLMRIKVSTKMVVIIFLIIVSCDISPNKNIIEINKQDMSVAELVSLGVEHRNDSALLMKIYERIQDTIGNSYYTVYSMVSTNEQAQKVSWAYYDYDFLNNPVNFRYTKKNALVLNIGNNQSLNPEYQENNSCEIKDFLTKFVSRTDSVCDCYGLKIIDYFGELMMPRGVVVIHLDTKEHNLYKDWKFFFDCVDEMFSFYTTRRNRLSLEKWGVEYENLTFPKKEAVTLVTNFNFHIVFN